MKKMKTVIIESAEGPLEFQVQKLQGGELRWSLMGRNLITGERRLKLSISDRISEAIRLLEMKPESESP